VVDSVDEEAGGDSINIGDLKKRSSMELELWSRRPVVSRFVCIFEWLNDLFPTAIASSLRFFKALNAISIT